MTTTATTTTAPAATDAAPTVTGSCRCGCGLDLTRAQELLVVVDRLVADAASAGRLAESVATAFQEGEGIALVLHTPLAAGRARLRFTRFPACSACDTPAAMVTPALFSFNNPRGACGRCNGFGAVLEYDESLVVPDPTRSIAQGAIDPWTKPRYESRRRMLLDFARKLGADPDKLPQAIESMLLRPELAFTPEPPTRSDLEKLIQAAW